MLLLFGCRGIFFSLSTQQPGPGRPLDLDLSSLERQCSEEANHGLGIRKRSPGGGFVRAGQERRGEWKSTKQGDNEDV